MSLPIIPNMTPLMSITTEQTIPLLLATIALEELALAHIINAKAEELQFVLGTLDTETTLSPPVVTLADLFAVDSSVQRTLRDVIKKEMLLEFKFENVLDLIASNQPVSSLTITKMDAPDPLPPGNSITYTITIANTGTTPLTNLTVTDATPTFTTFVSASAPIGFNVITPPVGGTGNIIFSIPVFNPSSSATFEIVVGTTPLIAPGIVITNTAVADANEISPVSASTTTTVAALP
jgi:uncharacterized repeat protein (TIGR01451 family)